MDIKFKPNKRSYTWTRNGAPDLTGFRVYAGTDGEISIDGIGNRGMFQKSGFHRIPRADARKLAKAILAATS